MRPLIELALAAATITRSYSALPVELLALTHFLPFTMTTAVDNSTYFCSTSQKVIYGLIKQPGVSSSNGHGLNLQSTWWLAATFGLFAQNWPSKQPSHGR